MAASTWAIPSRSCSASWCIHFRPLVGPEHTLSVPAGQDLPSQGLADSQPLVVGDPRKPQRRVTTTAAVATTAMAGATQARLDPGHAGGQGTHCEAAQGRGRSADAVTPHAFITKWRASALKERSVSQEHFIDLCHLLDEPTPAEGALTGCRGRGWNEIALRRAPSRRQPGRAAGRPTSPADGVSGPTVRRLPG